MVVSRCGLALLATLVLAILAPTQALAQPTGMPGMCRVINLEFTPGGIAAGTVIGVAPDPDRNRYTVPEITPQIVAWLESPTGEYLETVYVTQQIGRYGLGNRPGRFDFNSGPGWPYGRRITVFPVWAHKHGQSFPEILFQSGGDSRDSNLSHEFSKSSREPFFCRPLLKGEAGWDAATCSSTVYTDKGVFSPGSSRYPPRADLTPVAGTDSMSVAMFRQMNPFDAVTQATPRLGAFTTVSWPMPSSFAMGDYVLVMEVALEQDFNASYDQVGFPSPVLASYGEYGVAFRGQPSVIYRVPFAVSDVESAAMTDAFAGYGDPAGLDGKIREPDGTITTSVANSGASRLLLTSRDGDMYRLRVHVLPERDLVPPAAPSDMVITQVQGSSATLTFTAPGDDELAGGAVTGYEVHYVVGDIPLTDDNFDAANDLTFLGDVVAAGQSQVLTVKNLLPETEYTVAVRAYDNCHNASRVKTAKFTTAPRAMGTVDACFVATAAYGSVLANDVEMLRRFRDLMLRRSVLGELAVEVYYTFGPPVAGVVGESDLLRATARDALMPLVDKARALRW